MQTFDKWLDGVLAAANESLGTDEPRFVMDDIAPGSDSWKSYYDDGLSPNDAWQEDCSCA